MNKIRPDLPISSLTIADLEAMIADVVRRVLRDEIQRTGDQSAMGKPLSQEFLETFGTWQDAKSPEAIVADIYASRTISTREVNL